MITSKPVICQLLVLFCCNMGHSYVLVSYLFCCNTGHGYVPASDWSVVCFCFAVIRDIITSRPVIGQFFVLFCCNTGHDYIPARDWSGACFVLL